MRSKDLMCPDLLSEIVLLGVGMLILVFTIAVHSGRGHSHLREQRIFERGIMPPTIQVGTVLINDSPLITQLFGLDSEACS
jgi:hypothetical protein